MSKTAFFAARAAAAEAPKSGYFARFVGALSKAREQQAEREVSQYLSRQSDRMLQDIGMTDVEIDDLRAKFNR
jgi:uncharacterized protein YjiS (DUF1127 family)